MPALRQVKPLLPGNGAVGCSSPAAIRSASSSAGTSRWLSGSVSRQRRGGACSTASSARTGSTATQPACQAHRAVRPPAAGPPDRRHQAGLPTALDRAPAGRRLEDRSRRLDELDGDGTGPRPAWRPATGRWSRRRIVLVPPARADHQPRLRRLGRRRRAGSSVSDEADELIEQLVRRGCWRSSPGTGTRYRFQDLVRLHAREHGPRRESPHQRDFRLRAGPVRLAHARRRSARRSAAALRTRCAAAPPGGWPRRTWTLCCRFPTLAGPGQTALRSAMVLTPPLRMEDLAHGLTSLAIIPTTRDAPLLRALRHRQQ